MTKQEVRKLWVEALRSGEYKQGKGMLKSEDNEFCCLGVLTDICVKRGITDENSLQRYYPVDSVMRSVGLAEQAGKFYTNTRIEPSFLSVLNDDGVSFSEIADIIESNPRGLFTEEA